jgi:hypothetical protein
MHDGFAPMNQSWTIKIKTESLVGKIMPMAGQNTNLRFMAEPLTQKDPTAGSETCVIYWFFASFHAPQLHSSDAR